MGYAGRHRAARRQAGPVRPVPAVQSPLVRLLPAGAADGLLAGAPRAGGRLPGPAPVRGEALTWSASMREAGRETPPRMPRVLAISSDPARTSAIPRATGATITGAGPGSSARPGGSALPGSSARPGGWTQPGSWTEPGSWTDGDTRAQVSTRPRRRGPAERIGEILVTAVLALAFALFPAIPAVAAGHRPGEQPTAVHEVVPAAQTRAARAALPPATSAAQHGAARTAQPQRAIRIAQPQWAIRTA